METTLFVLFHYTVNSTILLLTLIVVSTYSDRENPRAGDDSLLLHLSIFRLEKT